MKPTDFSMLVTGFLTHHLTAQRTLSPNTIKAYRDVVNEIAGIETLIADSATDADMRALAAGEKPELEARRIIASLRCTRSSATYSRKYPSNCCNASRSSPFRCGDSRAPASVTSPGNTLHSFSLNRTYVRLRAAGTQ